MSNFIGYTVGLDAFDTNGSDTAILVKAEFSARKDGQIEIRLVSGRTLGQITKAGVVTISAEEYEDRPMDGVEQAVWAFEKLGYIIPSRAD